MGVRRVSAGLSVPFDGILSHWTSGASNSLLLIGDSFEAAMLFLLNDARKINK